MAIEYSFSRINPLCTCDSDGSNEQTKKVEFTLKGEETVHGIKYEGYANHEIELSGDACVAPGDLDLSVLLNTYVADNNVKDEIIASISGQKEIPHEWTGQMVAPNVS
mgnify:CR=1 FL=1